jgi:glutamate-ammonia-ligase adenylyltransferase
MSLPALATLPATLDPLARRAEQSLQAAFAELSADAAARFALWSGARQETLRRVTAASDFVVQQALRDPQMLLELAESGELERALQAGELRAQLAAQLLECESEDELGRRLRRFRNRQQLRIIWRDISRQADLIETCRDLSELADSCIDLAYHWLYPQHCAQFGTPLGRRTGQAQHMVIVPSARRQRVERV